MLKNLLLAAATLLALCRCDRDDGIIVTDDVLMLTVPATGLESAACANFLTNGFIDLPAGDTVSVLWENGKSLPNDTLTIMRLELRSDTGTVVQFTMTLRPKANAPAEIQCMKGFGCDAPWEYFPWKSPDGNFLDHTVFKFRVLPRGVSRFTVENYNADKSLQLFLNPPI
jgi:hypothetical protein